MLDLTVSRQEVTITQRLKIYLYSFAVVGFIGSVILGQSVVAKQLDSWQLLPRPERLSEVFFADYRKLPVSLPQGASSKLSFVVHNLERQATTYRYAITAMSAENPTIYPLREGVVSLKHDQSKTIQHTVTMPPVSGHTVVKVTLHYDAPLVGSTKLTPQTQSIHYWTTITTSGGSR